MQRLEAVSVSATGFVIGGANGVVDADGLALLHPTAWHSADGLAWQAVAMPEPEGVTNAGVNALVAEGGEFVAVGTARKRADVTGHVFNVIWTSNDGVTWQLADGQPSEAAADEAANAYLVVDGTVVLAGADTPQDGRDAGVWLREGDEWEKVVASEEEVFGGDGEQLIVAVAARGTTLVLVGTTGDEEESRDGLVWVIDLSA